MDTVWGGYVDIQLNRAPHWGRLGGNVYFAQGFSGHGVAATGLAGRVIGRSHPAARPGRLDAFAAHPTPQLPRRPRAAHADAGGRDGLVQIA